MTTDQNIKNKILESEIDTAFFVFFCNFAFIFNLQMCKEALLGN